MLDRNWREIKRGDRVTFRDTYYYINACGGAGVVREIDTYGGIYIDTDQPMHHHDRYGQRVRTGNDWYFCSQYDYDRKIHVAARRVGDPYEHIPVEVWVEVVRPNREE